ncbi:MAG: urea transporter [Candidatus Marinimicrobia bacterium]|nr:urea transporter [Candidatus Neomarinimicrobiota bacterium]MBL7022454.1 urea transporter [Candidatus Neomarinimicrobiota bacterium]MBL7108691.1 urea transporter [Candidatus Neomarinimicrobiota bacterium]
MKRLKQITNVTFLSYGVLAFSPHPITALIIFTSTLFYPVIGLMGLIGDIISNLTARWMHAHPDAWKSGIFGVSGILIGLALGKYTEPSLRMWIFLIAGSGISGIISVMLANFLSKYDLPILSLPFMIVIWLVLLTIGVVDDSVVSFAPITFLKTLDLWLFNFLPYSIFEYIKMFGSILFQDNLLSGVLVLIAIGLYSRVSIIYGLWGGFLGMLTYTFLHGNVDGFHGLNYVLTALAFGGFFIVSNRHGFVLASIAIVTVGLVDVAMTTVLNPINLPPLVFAFNMVTFVFLFPLKMLPQTTSSFRLIPIPLHIIKSPETNRRWYRRWSGQKNNLKTVITLPFMGEWTVLQGNHGEWTHKGVGQYAWDFVVRDERGHQASGFGNKVEDFYAFGLPVLAPAPGTVYIVENSVEDNPPQTANTERNWGNYVIIDHWNGEFSELSHFKQGSIIVVPGQKVTRGQILGYCGNSGRSPVPHIHYQLQAIPVVGSPTLPASFSEATVNGDIVSHSNPNKDDLISPIEIESEVEWSLIGREGEQWIFQCKTGGRSFKETLTFGTDEFGLPAILSDNNRLWRIIDMPNFVEIRPDYKTYPSLLSPSAFLKITGESLILPKKLLNNFKWNNGIVVQASDNWVVKSELFQITIDSKNGILDVKFNNSNNFQFKQISKVSKNK